MVHHLSQSIQTLEARSNTDALCGIANRRYVTDKLQEACDAASREKLELSVVLLDLDNFKIINDTYGHTVGDEVLRRVATIMRDTFPEGSIIGRYGGEEFIAILPSVAIQSAHDIADRFRETLETRARRESGVEVTASGGVTQWHFGDSPTTLTQRADQALYRAKAEGRNKVVRISGTLRR